jgi:hypothetical protein
MDAIEILELNLEQPEVVFGEQTAYWGRFEAALGSGEALLVPGPGRLDDLKGRRVRVQPAYLNLSGFELVSSKDSRGHHLTPLEKPGAFRLDGQISSLVWLEDEGSSSVLEVLVGAWLFNVAAAQIEPDELDYGQWVSFEVEGLIWKILDR